MKKLLHTYFFSIICCISSFACVADFFAFLKNPENEIIGNESLDIVAGSYHTCMLFKGQIRCWGDKDINGHGTPLGKFRSPNDISTLTFMGKDSLVKQITAGRHHTCALFEDESVRCWGQNNVGQLGVGSVDAITLTSSMSTQNIMFAGMEVKIKQIDAGNDHTCALSTDNQIFCWGSGVDGKLGNNLTINIGDNAPMTPIPAIVIPVMNNLLLNQTPVKLAAGENHTCVYFENSDILCWGSISELGDNGSGTGMTGVLLSAAAITAAGSSLVNLEIKDIVSGAGITCIQTADKRVICWGMGAAGQLGYGCGMAGTKTPTTHLVGVTSMPLMDSSNDDAFRVAYGAPVQAPITEPVAMGMTDTNCRETPTTTSYRNYTDIEQIVIGPGASYSCILRTDGTVHCFGINIGIHNFIPGSSVDVSLVGATNCMSEDTITTRMGAVYYPGGSPLGYDVALTVFSAEFPPTVTNTPIIARRTTGIPIGRQAIRIAAGESHVCALLNNGQIKCWGSNCFGQLGHGDRVGDATGGGANESSATITGGVASFEPLSSYGTFGFPF